MNSQQPMTGGRQLEKLASALTWASNHQVPVKFLLDMEEGLWLDTDDQLTLAPSGVFCFQSPHDGEEFSATKPEDWRLQAPDGFRPGDWLNIWLEVKEVV